MGKKYISILFVFLFIISVTGCNTKNNITDDELLNSDTSLDISTDIIALKDEDYYSKDWEENSNTTIKLKENSVEIVGSGATFIDKVVSIKEPGTYVISGKLNDGQIRVNLSKEETAKVILNNADITCSNNSAIYIEEAYKVILSMVPGSENIITDGTEYISSSDATATIYSMADLTINGEGKLIVNANYNDGICSKDDLNIVSGDISITSVDDGIIGKDMVKIINGNIDILALGDGIKSTNEEQDRGYVVISEGNINIVGGSDGIQAKTSLLIDNGTFNIVTGGGSENSSTKNNTFGKENNSKIVEDDDITSSKALKATKDILITSGTFNIDSLDDAIHSNSDIVIENGNFIIKSGDDGIHADSTINIKGGKLDIEKSYEGIEATSITILDGEINIVSTDDGINVAGGNDLSSQNGRPGQNNFNMIESENKLYILGGYITIDASGDGIDVNGVAYISGGNIIVNGPENGGNSAIDYGNVFEVTGGVLIASGSSQMAQNISSSSAQCGVNIILDNNVDAGTNFKIKDSEGNEIINITPKKKYSSVVVSTPDFKNEEEYSVYVDENEMMKFTINDTVMVVSNNPVNMNKGNDRRPIDKMEERPSKEFNKTERPNAR